MKLEKNEIYLIRKALQLMSIAHTCVETEDKVKDRETPVDRLIRKMRRAEAGEEIEIADVND